MVLVSAGGSVKEQVSAVGLAASRPGSSCRTTPALAAIVGAALMLPRERRTEIARRYFYVSAIREGQAVFVTGPYSSRTKAAGHIDRVRDTLTAPLHADQAELFDWGVSESPRRCDGLANAIVGFHAEV